MIEVVLPALLFLGCSWSAGFAFLPQIASSPSVEPFPSFEFQTVDVWNAFPLPFSSFCPHSIHCRDKAIRVQLNWPSFHFYFHSNVNFGWHIAISNFSNFSNFWNDQCHSKYRDECNQQFQNSLMVINGTVIDLITEDKFHFNEATVDLALLCKWISEWSNDGSCIAH